MKCPICGNDMPENFKFCTKCGRQIVHQSKSLEDEKKQISGYEHEVNNMINEKKKVHTGKGKYYFAIVAAILIGIIIGVIVKSKVDFNSEESVNVVSNDDADDSIDETLNNKDYSDHINDDHIEEVSAAGNKDEADVPDDEAESASTDYNAEPVETEQKNETADPNDEEEKQAVITDSSINVEECVLSIREQYNNIVKNINKGSYKKKCILNGIVAYFDGNDIQAIIVPKNSDGNNYSQSYYYDNGNLIFAYYEGKDSHRLYFSDDNLIRWRYCEKATKPDKAENHDLENSSDYLYWNSIVLEDSYRYVQSAIE